MKNNILGLQFFQANVYIGGVKNGSDKHKRSSRGAHSRSRILAAAANAFSELGPEATMRHVARTAGVNIATLLYHFPSKEELFAEVVSMMDGGELAIVNAWQAGLADDRLARLESLREALTELGVLIVDRVIADPSRFRLGLYSALEASGQGAAAEAQGAAGASADRPAQADAAGGLTLPPSPEKAVVRAALARAVELGTLACGPQEIDDYIEGFTYLSRGFAIAHVREISSGSEGRDAIARRFRQLVRRYVNNMLPGTRDAGG